MQLVFPMSYIQTYRTALCAKDHHTDSTVLLTIQALRDSLLMFIAPTQCVLDHDWEKLSDSELRPSQAT